MARPERSFRTLAIILKRKDFGEADRLLTIITPEYGKLDVIAKGARKPVSSKTGHVELFTRADMLISRGRDLGIATQVEMVEPYLPLREDLQRGAYASYAVELLDTFMYIGDDNTPILFDLLDETLQRLCIDDDLRRVVRYYEVHLLDAVGFRPELNRCIFTHEEVKAEDQFFSYTEGGVVSPLAAQHGTDLVAISVNVLKLMRHMQRSPYTLVNNLKMTQQRHNELEKIQLGYITHLLERRLRSVDFIRRIRSFL